MVLVTGASGFLGLHLVRYLSERGLKVRALYNNHPPAGNAATLTGVIWMRCDLLDVFEVEEAMAGISQIYHCAAIVSFSRRMHDKMLHFNPESTANIVNQALTQGNLKLVYVSSVAALGQATGQGKEITEEEEGGESQYISAYGLSKYLAEIEVWRGIGEGLDAVIVNPGIILGQGGEQSGASRLMAAADGEFKFYTLGVTAWVDVNDVVKVLYNLMTDGPVAERYIISAGNFSYREIISLMAKALGRKTPQWYASPALSGISWRLSGLYSLITGKRSPITRETVAGAQAVSLYNNRKYLNAYPAFNYTALNETIEGMAKAWVGGK